MEASRFISPTGLFRLHRLLCHPPPPKRRDPAPMRRVLGSESQLARRSGGASGGDVPTSVLAWQQRITAQSLGSPGFWLVIWATRISCRGSMGESKMRRPLRRAFTAMHSATKHCSQRCASLTWSFNADTRFGVAGTRCGEELVDSSNHQFTRYVLIFCTMCACAGRRLGDTIT